MKKTLLIGLFSAMALGAYAQGTISFSSHSGEVFHIYSPQTGNGGAPLYGDSTGKALTGGTGGVDALYAEGASTASSFTSVDYYAAGSVLLGGTSGTGPASTPYAGINYTYGNDFTAELYALAGAGQPASSLLPVTQYQGPMRPTSSSPAAIGAIIPNAISGTDTGIPNTSGGVATVAVACWYNANGTITDLATAKADGVPWGESLPVTLTALGVVTGSPVANPAETLYGIQSFSLTTVPEPSTIALGVLGVCAFLARRRKA
jgi:hypothetical protein